MTIDNFKSFLKENPVIPVATLSGDEDAVHISRLLKEGGIPVIEVTLRTPEAYNCIRTICREVPGMTVGAGSILSLKELDMALNAGASFCVAPNLNEKVLNHAISMKVPFIPGIATPSELGYALEKTDIIKIFPIAQLGGPAYIKAASAPFRKLSFSLIPTGGITTENLKHYLDTEPVIACGMSYMVESSLIEKKEWSILESRIKETRSIISEKS